MYESACQQDVSRRRPRRSRRALPGPRRRGRQAGFTLTEMMAVILILMILIALVVGVSMYVQTEATKQETRVIQTILLQAIDKYYQSTGHWPSDAGSNLAKPTNGVASYWPAAYWNAHRRSNHLFAQLQGNEGARASLVNLPRKAIDAGWFCKKGGCVNHYDSPKCYRHTGSSAKWHKYRRFVDGFGYPIDYTLPGGVPLLTSPGPYADFDTKSDNIRSDEGI